MIGGEGEGSAMTATDDADDPVLEAELDRALAPYRGLVSDEVLAQLRETLGDALASHPVGSLLLDRTRPPPVVVKSGEVAKDAGEAEEASVKRRRGGG